MHVRFLIAAVLATTSFIPSAMAFGTFCGAVFDDIQQEMHDVMAVRRIDWIESNDVAQIRNFEILKESIAALMRKPSEFEAMSIESATDRAVVLFREDKSAVTPEATVFVLADKKNVAEYAWIVRDVIGLHKEIFSDAVKQLNFYVPIERGDIAKNVGDAAKSLGLTFTSIETDPTIIKKDLLPGTAVPVDEFYDLVEIYSPANRPTSGNYYLVTVFLD